MNFFRFFSFFTSSFFLCLSLYATKIIKKNNYIAFYNKNNRLFKIIVDSNKNGIYDTIKFINNKNRVYRIKKDINEDKYFETTIIIKNGKVTQVEKDINKDNKTDEILKYSLSGNLKEKLVDKNYDGKFDYFLIIKNNNEKIEKIDTNYDGNIDKINYYKNNKIYKTIFPNKKIIFYDKKGYPEKIEESGKILYYKNGELTKVLMKFRELDYKNGKIIEEKIDTNKNNKFDTFIFYRKGEKIIKKDRNEDNKIDYIEIQKNFLKIIKTDNNFDSFFDTIIYLKNNKAFKKEFFKKGCSKPIKIETENKILYDMNCNGIYEKMQQLKNNLKYIYLDKNEDKKFEKILIFSPNNNLLEIKEDTSKDGKFDTFIFLKNGKIYKIEKDSNHNGKVDTWKFYKNGKLLYIQKDLNNDGKPDIKF